ncbi:MAG: PIN domain-containing protein [Candidatus Binatia bacterium]
MTAALIADTGGLLRALAKRPDGRLTWPEYAKVLRQATLVVVPALVLAEVDYFLQNERAAMRKLVAELLDPATTYEFEAVLPSDVVRALQIDAKFNQLAIGLVDGTVAAVAERCRIYRVLTTDRRDFGTLRVGERYDKVLTLLP